MNQPDTDPQFGSPDCTCIPWTTRDGKPRYCQPGDTVDMISGWERGGDCPHHAPAVVPPVDRAALRDRIREVLARSDGFDFESLEPHDYQIQAAAVLAVLPEPTDRAAVLREAAAVADEVVPPDLPRNDRDQGRIDAAADIRNWADHVEQEALRRMADETQRAVTEPVDLAERRDRYEFAIRAAGDAAYGNRPFYEAITAAVIELADAEQAGLRRERDLAIAHDRQPYPTAWAYEQACKAREKHRERVDFLTRVLDLFSLSHADAYGDLFWRVDDDEVRLFANVSDVFAWGGSDCEDITPDTLPALEQAYTDLKAVGGEEFMAELYAARQRGMRPQGAAYPSGTHEAWRKVSALYDACGPERELGLGNPKAAPAHEAVVEARQDGAQS